MWQRVDRPCLSSEDADRPSISTANVPIAINGLRSPSVVYGAHATSILNKDTAIKTSEGGSA